VAATTSELGETHKQALLQLRADMQVIPVFLALSDLLAYFLSFVNLWRLTDGQASVERAEADREQFLQLYTKESRARKALHNKVEHYRCLPLLRKSCV
jgi:hypothetical protein